MDYRVPKRGELALAYLPVDNPDLREAYRLAALRSGGRVRFAVGEQARALHLQIYTPTFEVKLEE